MSRSPEKNEAFFEAFESQGTSNPQPAGGHQDCSAGCEASALEEKLAILPTPSAETKESNTRDWMYETCSTIRSEGADFDDAIERRRRRRKGRTPRKCDVLGSMQDEDESKESETLNRRITDTLMAVCDDSSGDQTASGAENVVVCDLTEDSDNDPENASQHVDSRCGIEERDVNVDENSVTCEQCKKKFASRALYRKHSKIHSDRQRFACEACDAAYVKKETLRSHVKAGHKKYSQCTFCTKYFKSALDLVLHFEVCPAK